MATSQRMLRFVSVDKQMPDKRQARSRIADFSEIYAEFDTARAAEQAGRCSQCGVPFSPLKKVPINT